MKQRVTRFSRYVWQKGFAPLIDRAWAYGREHMVKAAIALIFTGTLAGSGAAEAAGVPNPVFGGARFVGKVVRAAEVGARQSEVVASIGARTHQTIDDDISGGRFSLIEYDDVALGPPISGTDVMDIGGDSTAATTIYVELLEITDSAFPKLVVEDASVHVEELETVTADGVSIGSTIASTSDVLIHTTDSDRNIQYTRVGSDKGVLSAETADADVKVLRIKGSNFRGGDVKLHDMSIGKLRIVSTKVGKGDGLDAQDLVIDSSVSIGSRSSTDVVEDEVEVR